MNNSFDIAIIGMSCRFPGADDLDSFWNNLANGIESITHFTDDELRQSGISDELINNPNYVKAAPILSDPGMFDASFFGYTPMEAKTMDPQHRILLECAHQALEHSGYDSEKYDGRIGVFTGSAMNTYFMNSILRSKFVDEYIPTLIGNDKDFLSTRISYKLNLKGPSVNVQTACSTSLVAVHLACQSLISEESDMVLAGAVSVKAPHKAGYICDGGGIVSKDAQVRAFDANANGTVFGSGCGVVVLKRLTDAIKDNDTIHAVIKGSAINNDGSEKAGYTAPSVNSQADAVIEALSLADVEAETITYIEAHGSGTPMGDPIELAALTKAFKNYNDHTQFCAIGSVKTNIGHLDAAAGMAGLIKTVLSLKNKKIPPSINFSEPNPEIDFASSPFFVNSQLSDWKSISPRRAGIMSTGMGGTNAYLILEEAPEEKKVSTSSHPNILLLSAKNEAALDQSAKKLSVLLKGNDSIDISDAAYTLQLGRKTYKHRRFLVCKDKTDAIEILEQEKSKRILSGELQNTSKRPVIFLFPGIGDHYVGMGYDLYQNLKVFKDEVDKCADILKNFIDVDIREVIYPKDFKREESENSKGIDLKKMLASRVNKAADEYTLRLNQTLYAQPALLTIEYALAKLWMHLGVKPDAIVGHSMGEYVAACLAGVFSLEDALKLIAIRAKLVNELPQGGMLAVTLPENELIHLLNDGLSISLINSPNLCVVAGPEEKVNQFEEVLKNKQILYRQVQNAHAFHSKMLDPIYDDYTKEIKKIKLNSPNIPFTSNLTGNWITDREATDPIYWAKHANNTARFSNALEKAWQINDAIFLEVGPGNTLSVLAMQHPESKKSNNPVTISTLRPEYDNQFDLNYLFTSIGKFWLSGVEIDWEKLYQDEKPKRIPLPTYPYQKENYWIEEKPETIKKTDTEVIKNNLRNEFKDWFYVPSWKRTALVSSNPNIEKLRNTNWLIFSSGSKLEKQVINKLNELACKQIVVKKGKKFSFKNDQIIEINPRSEADYRRLFHELSNINFNPDNILHFWNYYTSDKLTSSIAKLESSYYDSIYSLLFIVKNSKIFDGQKQIGFEIVTKNLHNVLGNEQLASPEVSLILGPARVMNREIENVYCRCIDFSDYKDTKDDQSTQLLNEIVQKDGQEIIAYRGKYRWLQSFEHVDLAGNSEPDDVKINKLKPGGVYLITGGTGGLGLVFAEHFSKTENVRIILATNFDFPERSQWQNWVKEKNTDNKINNIIMKIMKIEELGSTVEVQVCDISDETETKHLITRIKKKYGKIDGIIHAAGTYDDKIIYQKNLKSINDILSPKILGMINLYKILNPKELDFLVSFSSISSIITFTGQFDYSAANIYLDAITDYLNSKGLLNVISVNWSAWKEVGILPNLKVEPNKVKWKEAEIDKAIFNTEGLKAFSCILNSNLSRVIVSPEPLKIKITKKVSDISNKTKVIEKTDVRNSKDVFLNQNETSSTSTLHEIEIKLISIWQEILGVKKIKRTYNFFELGGHSLLAIQLLSSIRKSFNIDIDIQVLFEAPTLEEMTLKILEEVNNFDVINNV